MEWHYVHAYNPDWFNVPPQEMLMTHYPTFDFFQMLENPVSIEDFNKGMEFIYSNYQKAQVSNSTARAEGLPWYGGKC